MGSQSSTQKEPPPPSHPVKRNTVKRVSHFLIVENNNLRWKRRMSKIEEEELQCVSPTTKQPVKSENGLPKIEEDVREEDIDFPYENLVLEGGGSQGNAYIGAVMELERLNLLPKIRRFAGASVGSMTACYLAVGHGSSKLMTFITEGPQFTDMLDAPCGKCSMVPNIFTNLGWHPGRAPYYHVGKAIEEKMGNPNATFKDLYEKTGRELCVIVTNLSTMMEEYCHVKTTPNMPMRIAVRMSVAAPGVFMPVKRQYMGRTDLYIDGGMLCNYGVHCFDGWWLSMKPEDSFLRKMRPLEDVAKLLTKKERFGMVNEKTFGMIIYSDYDSHVLATNPALVAPIAPIPNTKLSRAHEKVKKKRELNCKQHHLVTDAMTRFLNVLNRNNLDGSTINIDVFKQAFNNNEEFTPHHARILFGNVSSVEEIFESLDANSDGEIDFNELMSLAEQEGVGIQTHQIGTGRLDIKNVTDYLAGIFTMFLLNVKKAFLEGSDIERTVLINTVYIKSFDLTPEAEDLDFLVEQGRRGIRTFLKYHKNKKSELQPNVKDDTNLHVSG